MLENIKNKHLLIDGDIIKYRCAASAEKTKYLVETIHAMNMRDYDLFDTHKEAKEHAEYFSNTYIWSRKEVQPVEFAREAVKTAINSLFEKLTPKRTSIFLSPERNFRHDVARTKTYKGNRVQPKPKWLKECERYLVNEYGATVCDFIEADDAIGRALTESPADSVSVSIDKDLLQVPGWHYDWVNDRVRNISRRAGDLAFYTQMLTGDVTDNIPGLEGVGEVRASKVLEGVRSRADAATRVWGEYRRVLGDADEAREYFMEQSRLLWILHGDAVGGEYICPIPLEG